MRSETAFRLVASACLDDIAAAHGPTCTGDAAALHNLRIALTRLRAAIAFYAPLVADDEWKRLKSELKWLNGFLGAARDLDVACENGRGSPDEHVLDAARADAHDNLERALQSERYRNWLAGMWDWIGHGPWSAQKDERSIAGRATPVSEFHARRLARWHEKLVARSRGLQGMGKGKRHRLRIASKRLRYAIEFSEGALPEDDFARWNNVLKQLRKGQKILGELNDAEVRRSLISDLAAIAQRPAQPTSGRAEERKRKSQLLRRAAIVYRKIAD